jgi:plastocyanin
MNRSVWIYGGAVMVAATMAACGGGSSNGGTPTAATPTTTTTTTAPTGGGGNPATATITIGTDGRVSPSSVTIAPGGRVTFVNNHNRAHDMESDPHPEHTDCPPMEQVGFLNPGQTRTSGNFTVTRTCGFHDHNDFENTGLQGRIIIQ